MHKRFLVVLTLIFSHFLWADIWAEKVIEKVSPHWKGARIEVQILDSTSEIPQDASLSLRGTDAYIGLVSIHWNWADKNVVKTKYGMARINVSQKIAVAKEAIVHGQSFEPHLIEFQERQLGGLHQMGYFTEVEELKLRRSIGFIAKGTVLTRRNVTEPLWVERGQRVKLHQLTGDLHITAEMESLEMGGEGDWIRIRHPKTRRIWLAKVIGLGELALEAMK